MHILVAFVCKGDVVEMDLYYLHPRVTVSVCGPVARGILHAMTLAKVRPLLDALSLVRRVQDVLESTNRRYARMDIRVHKRMVDPVTLHDACTLYAGILSAYFGKPAAYSALGVTCECGHDEWGYTCTPPRLTKHGLTRDFLDEPVPFCWTCVRRSEDATAVAHAASTAEWTRASLLSLLFDAWV